MKAWLLTVYEFAFCCHHRRLSRLITLKKRTYAVCLNCGHRFDYSWQDMAFRSAADSIPMPSRSDILRRTA
jgi:hypothetical protein